MAAIIKETLNDWTTSMEGNTYIPVPPYRDGGSA